MKKTILFIALSTVVISCNKEKQIVYTCDCSTITGPGTMGNHVTYTVVETTVEGANISCGRQYDGSGKATQGIFCKLK